MPTSGAAALSCRDASGCRAGVAAVAGPAETMPREGDGRAVMLVLRYIAAAGETGDAACWDAALDVAEQAFGGRDGPLLVGRAARLLRRLGREGARLRFLPPPCRRLSTGEALLLAALRAGAQADQAWAPDLSAEARSALADLAEPFRPAGSGPALAWSVPAPAAALTDPRASLASF